VVETLQIQRTHWADTFVSLPVGYAWTSLGAWAFGNSLGLSTVRPKS
jgi:hypothetical protein